MKNPPKIFIKPVKKNVEVSIKRSRAVHNNDTIEKVELTEEEIRDENGVVEKHTVVIEEEECDSAAGDYLPDHPACIECQAKLLCIINAISFGKITKEAVPPTHRNQVEAAVSDMRDYSKTDQPTPTSIQRAIDESASREDKGLVISPVRRA